MRRKALRMKLMKLFGFRVSAPKIRSDQPSRVLPTRTKSLCREALVIRTSFRLSATLR